MKIAMAQTDVEQGDIKKNILKVDNFASRAKKEGADLIVFPEMFVCGFDYKKNMEFLESNSGSIEEMLCKIAQKHSISLCGSIPHLCPESDLATNRFIFIDDSGKIVSHYDKIHLFSVFNEDKYVKAGDEIVVADTKFGKIGFAVCYDIRFPDIFVRMTKRGAKLIIISAAFPHPRSEHWRILSRARAIENQCFIVAVNRGGTEKFGNNQVKYFGMSAIIDPWGGIVSECPEDAADDIAIADVNLDEIDTIRTQIPSLKDRREDLY